MALRSGLARQIGIKTETTFGTAVVPDLFLPMVSESFSRKQARVVSKAALAGRAIGDSAQRKLGSITLDGSVGLELAKQSQVTLWKHMLGGSAVSGAGDPYTHTFTPSANAFAGLGFTMQLGRPPVGNAGVAPFRFAGCKLTGWEISAESGDDPITLGIDVVGSVDEDTATALASASYATGAAVPYTGHETTVAVAGSDLPSRSVTLSADLAQKVDRRKLGSRVIREPVVAGRQMFTGKLTTDFDSMAQYNRYITGADTAVVIASTDGDYSVTATLNVDFETGSLNAGDDDILTLEQDFTCWGDGSDADAITVVVLATQATV